MTSGMDSMPSQNFYATTAAFKHTKLSKVVVMDKGSRTSGTPLRAIFWVTLVMTIWSTSGVGATRPAEVNNRAYPNIIYRTATGGMAKPGDTCNLNHRNVTGTTEVNFTTFDLPCESPSTCDYVFDKRGYLIPLSTEKVLIRGYPDTSGNISDVRSQIYFKKCTCPMSHTFRHSNMDCTLNPLPQQPVGIYCSGTVQHTKTRWPLALLLFMPSTALVFNHFN